MEGGWLIADGQKMSRNQTFGLAIEGNIAQMRTVVPLLKNFRFFATVSPKAFVKPLPTRQTNR
jgi:hypothetical protein